MYKVTKKCPHCDTALEFATDLGQRMVFTAHDDGFCAMVTRERVRMLEQVILSQRESYERSIADRMRSLKAYLAKRGLPSLDEMLRPEREMNEVKLKMAQSDRVGVFIADMFKDPAPPG